MESGFFTKTLKNIFEIRLNFADDKSMSRKGVKICVYSCAKT